MSLIKCRMKALQPDTGVVGGELPIDLGLNPVASRLPGGDLGAQHFEGVNAAIEALTDHHIEFDLGDVEPAAVLGGKDELKAVPRFLWWFQTDLLRSVEATWNSANWNKKTVPTVVRWSRDTEATCPVHARAGYEEGAAANR